MVRKLPRIALTFRQLKTLKDNEKKYINPDIEIVEIQTVGMLASSIDFTTGTITPSDDNATGDALAPELPGIPPFVFE